MQSLSALAGEWTPLQGSGQQDRHSTPPTRLPAAPPLPPPHIPPTTAHHPAVHHQNTAKCVQPEVPTGGWDFFFLVLRTVLPKAGPFNPSFFFFFGERGGLSNPLIRRDSCSSRSHPLRSLASVCSASVRAPPAQHPCILLRQQHGNRPRR